MTVFLIVYCIILGALIRAGLSVWNDENLSPGDVYLRAIGEAIVSSKVFVILLSSTSVKSKYCQVCYLLNGIIKVNI